MMLIHPKSAVAGEETQKLDRLFGAALLDSDIHQRLLDQRDPTLFIEFELADETQMRLRQIRATTLTEMAWAILNQ